MPTQTTHNSNYKIGCPVWNCDAWKGSVYPASAPKDSWLKHYSQVFNSVEGNSTFYGLPGPNTFQRWADRTSNGFAFALKFPRIISHEKELVGAQTETELFLDGLQLLRQANRLGPTFLQLGPRFDDRKFHVLEHFLQRLPGELPWAVEVRHLSWFEEPAESELNQLLQSMKIDRVIFDSRPLYSAAPTDEFEVKSQSRKPRSPIREFVTGSRPMLRLVGRNCISDADPWIEQWAPKVAAWIDAGLEPYIFLHSPNDAFAPQFAMRFHNRLSQSVPAITAIDSWPHTVQVQQQLF